MDLTVAVRAQQHAFAQLGDDQRPSAWDAVGRDRELLRRGIKVMEFEGRDRRGGPAALATAAEELDRSLLGAPARFDHRSAGGAA